ncbi:unnamed protein product, partial [Notodromas monacha]
AKLSEFSGKDLLACKADWIRVSQDPNMFSSCLEKLLLAVAPQASSPEGITLLGIPSFNPIKLDNFELPRNIPLKGSVKNVVIYNVTSAFNRDQSSIIYDVPTKTAILTVNLPSSIVETTYDLKLDLSDYLGFSPPEGAQQIDGARSRGKTRTRLDDVVCTCFAVMREKKKGGLVIEKASAQIRFGKFKMLFEPYDRDDQLARLMNIVAETDGVKPIVESMSIPIASRMSAMLGNLFHQGWKRLSDL